MKAASSTRKHDSGAHDLILATARQVLGEEGEPVNLALVARRAGLNRGTLYSHFKTGEQLFTAAAAEMHDEFSRMVLDDRGTVDRVMLRFARFMAENPGFSWVSLLRLFNSKRPANDPLLRHYLQRLEEFTKTVIAQPAIDAEVLAVTMLAGTLVWPLWVRARTNDRKERREMAQRFSREILRLSRRGVRQPGKAKASSK